MVDFVSKEQYEVKFWVSDEGYLCIAQENHELGREVILLLGPDAVELLEANIQDIKAAQRKSWF
jgi:hypothetical protein